MVQLATRNVLHNRRSPQNLHVATPIAHLVTQPYAPPEVTPEVAFQSITSGCSLQVLNTASDWVANSRFLCCASSVVRRCEVNRTATCTHHGWYIQTLPSAPPRTSRCSQCYFRLQFTAADIQRLIELRTAGFCVGLAGCASCRGASLPRVLW